MLRHSVYGQAWNVFIHFLSDRMTGRVQLNALEFFAFHGWHDFEREKGNTFRVHISYTYDMARAALSDELEYTVDYQRIHGLVAEIMQTPCRLLEHLAAKIVHSIRIQFPEIQDLEVRVEKMDPPFGSKAGPVSVTLASTYAEYRQNNGPENLSPMR